MRPSTSLAAASLLSLAYAYPKITSPKAGASIPAGTLTVEWKDNGDTPALDAFSGYTITLMVGANEGSTMTPVIGFATLGDIDSGSASQDIPLTQSKTVKNGFFIQMIATAIDGGTLTTYSDRFTLTGLTGVLDPAIEAAATGQGTKGPDTVNAVVSDTGANAPAAAADSDTPANAAAFTVPFNEQVGLTRYAPMQQIPPTKITKKKASPLFPTSAFTIARTWLPVASVQTTVTQTQTYSVKSIENTVAAAAGPTDDMQKFLARWKD